MKYLKFIEDVYDDDILVFKKGERYPVSYESDNAYIIGTYGIDISLESTFYIIQEEED